jgi:O-antigen/teichoic acid export membrane protein
MKVKTKGISPKLIAAVLTAVVTYLVGQEALELPVWAVVVGQAVLVAAAAYAANAGLVEPASRDELKEKVAP